MRYKKETEKVNKKVLWVVCSNHCYMCNVCHKFRLLMSIWILEREKFCINQNSN